MEWFWTWGGRCFGYRDVDDLWTYDGRHVGSFRDNEVYACDSRYLGEIMSGNRLITNKSKKSCRRGSFTPQGHERDMPSMLAMQCMPALRISPHWRSEHTTTAKHHNHSFCDLQKVGTASTRKESPKSQGDSLKRYDQSAL